jgi:hypothetical protein
VQYNQQVLGVLWTLRLLLLAPLGRNPSTAPHTSLRRHLTTAAPLRSPPPLAQPPLVALGYPRTATEPTSPRRGRQRSGARFARPQARAVQPCLGASLSARTCAVQPSSLTTLHALLGRLPLSSHLCRRTLRRRLYPAQAGIAAAASQPAVPVTSISPSASSAAAAAAAAARGLGKSLAAKKTKSPKSPKAKKNFKCPHCRKAFPKLTGVQVRSLGDAKSSRWVTLRARWVTLRARWVTLRARWVTLRACWVTLRARWVTLRARWVTLRARWVTLRARWVTLRARWVTFAVRRHPTRRLAWRSLRRTSPQTARRSCRRASGSSGRASTRGCYGTRTRRTSRRMPRGRVTCVRGSVQRIAHCRRCGPRRASCLGVAP